MGKVFLKTKYIFHLDPLSTLKKLPKFCPKVRSSERSHWIQTSWILQLFGLEQSGPRVSGVLPIFWHVYGIFGDIYNRRNSSTEAERARPTLPGLWRHGRTLEDFWSSFEEHLKNIWRFFGDHLQVFWRSFGDDLEVFLEIFWRWFAGFFGDLLEISLTCRSAGAGVPERLCDVGLCKEPTDRRRTSVFAFVDVVFVGADRCHRRNTSLAPGTTLVPLCWVTVALKSLTLYLKLKGLEKGQILRLQLGLNPILIPIFHLFLIFSWQLDLWEDLDTSSFCLF